jgi:Replicase family
MSPSSFVAIDTDGYLVYINLSGTIVPLVRSRTLVAASKFKERAQTWHSWNWLLGLIFPVLQTVELLTELGKYAREDADLLPVTVEDVFACQYFAPPDDLGLEEWVDTIVFGATGTEVGISARKLVEYHSHDHKTTTYAPADAAEHPHIRVPRNIIMVDWDDDWQVVHFEGCGVPVPSKILVNPNNLHAHFWWTVRGVMNRKAVDWAKAIKRGLTRKLGGSDLGVHLYTKNPAYPGWEVTSNEVEYDLSELDAVLTKSDKAWVYKHSDDLSHMRGKNPRDFEKYRHIAYATPHVSADDLEQQLWCIGQSLGYESDDNEFRKICRDIAIGEDKGKWPGYTSGIRKSRRTYFRHKALGEPKRGRGRPRKFSSTLFPIVPNNHGTGATKRGRSQGDPEIQKIADQEGKCYKSIARRLQRQRKKTVDQTPPAPDKPVETSKPLPQDILFTPERPAPLLRVSRASVPPASGLPWARPPPSASSQ